MVRKSRIQKLGEIRIPILSPLITRFRVSRAKRSVDKLESKLHSICHGAGHAKDLIEKAENSAVGIDSKKFYDQAKGLRERFDDRIAKACDIAIEIEKGDKAPAVKHEVVDPKRERFIKDGAACNSQVSIRTKPSGQKKTQWVDCMKQRGYTGVASYLDSKGREKHPL
jgi:hypothetical protein